MNENENKMTLIGYVESHGLLEDVDPEEITEAREDAQKLAELYRNTLETIKDAVVQRDDNAIFMVCLGDCLVDAIAEFTGDPDGTREKLMNWIVNQVEQIKN